ncbi:hypothetical protein [Mycobacterium deserti]|uniref:DUF4386 domain-containing protein n=1 Tax=Mycobacterium deserti TaxID=2978347 RepID=A0ABT2M5L5_9MYCO|nr:hypothetical protein [Mycobacterium deserti]MCT7657542.1 hypothetical protein [Mycobacterium deserti]
MTRERWMLGRRGGGVAGLALALLWTPMALVIPEFPDLAGPAGVGAYYAEHADAMKLVLCSASLGFVAFLIFLGELIAELIPRRSAWTWSALASALMFMTALCVAFGVVAAAVLGFERASPEAVWLAHAVAFLLAAPAAAAGTTFFIAVAVLAFDGLWPHGFGWLSAVGAVVNLAALAGFFSLTGAPNSGNGLLGGMAGPVAIWVMWIVAVSVHWLRHPRSPATHREAVTAAN